MQQILKNNHQLCICFQESADAKESANLGLQQLPKNEHTQQEIQADWGLSGVS